MKRETRDMNTMTRGAVVFAAWVEGQRKDGRAYADVDRSLGQGPGTVARWLGGRNIPSRSARMLIEQIVGVRTSWWDEAVERASEQPTKSAAGGVALLQEILEEIRQSNNILRQILAPPMPSIKSNGAQSQETVQVGSDRQSKGA